MDTEFLCRFLLYALGINYAILLLWFGVFVFARAWMRQLHGRWFSLSDASFDALHYGGMAIYKIACCSSIWCPCWRCMPCLKTAKAGFPSPPADLCNAPIAPNQSPRQGRLCAQGQYARAPLRQ